MTETERRRHATILQADEERGENCEVIRPKSFNREHEHIARLHCFRLLTSSSWQQIHYLLTYGKIIFCRVNFVCWLLFGVRSISVLPQWLVKDPGHSTKSAGGRLHLKHVGVWSNEVGVDWLCRCPGIVWEPFRKRAHAQLVREQLVTVVSAHWATVDWSWLKRVELVCAN